MMLETLFSDVIFAYAFFLGEGSELEWGKRGKREHLIRYFYESPALPWVAYLSTAMLF